MAKSLWYDSRQESYSDRRRWSFFLSAPWRPRLTLGTRLLLFLASDGICPTLE